MNRNLLAAVVSGALALPMAAQVQADSATLYGNLRYGMEMTDSDRKDEDAVWNIAADKGSRWGVKGSMDAMNNTTAGFKFERNLGDMTARHHNVYLSGAFGTATFGQQDSPYYGATTWDGSQTFGGITDGASRVSGVSFASNLGGPFSFSALVGSGRMGKDATSEGADHLEVSGKLAMGSINLTLGYLDSTTDEGGVDVSRFGGTVGGDLAAINWEIGYDVGTDTCKKSGRGMPDCDDERFGFHVGYDIVENGNVYAQYSDQDFDDMANEKDKDGWAFGYSHVLGKNVVVYAAYAVTDSMVENDDGIYVDDTTTKFATALKVGF